MPVSKTKISPKQAMKALRRGKKGPSDIVMVLRGRLDQQGEWDIEVEALHWLHEATKETIGPSGLPYGFPIAAGKELLSLGANDSAEKSIGGLGTALGREFIKTVASGSLDGIGAIFKDKA